MRSLSPGAPPTAGVSETSDFCISKEILYRKRIAAPSHKHWLLEVIAAIAAASTTLSYLSTCDPIASDQVTKLVTLLISVSLFPSAPPSVILGFG